MRRVADSSARRGVALDRLLEELRRAPRSVRYRDPVTDEVREDELTAATVAGVVRLYAYAPQLAAMVPRTLAEAAAGRPEVLMAQARMVDELVGEQFAQGVQLSVICAEDAGRLRVDRADERTLLAPASSRSCSRSARSGRAAGGPPTSTAPCRATGPVLLLSGELDR